MNCFCFSGNLGRPAELRYTQSGTAVLSFAVPVKSGYGDKEKTTWVDCAMFGKRAEGKLVDYLKKGTPVVVSGEASLETFEKRDKTMGAKISVRVNDVTLMGRANVDESQEPYQAGSNAQGSRPAATGGGENAPAGSGDLDDDIPF